MKKNPAVIAVLFCLFVIILNIAASFTIIKNEESEIRAAEDDILFKERGNGNNFIDPAAAELEAFKKRLPDDRGVTGVLERLFKSAQKNGIMLPKGDYIPQTVKEGGISRYTILFPVEGSYSRIKKFIYDLEVMRDPLTIEEITFSRSKSAEGTIELNIKLSAYFR